MFTASDLIEKVENSLKADPFFLQYHLSNCRWKDGVKNIEHIFSGVAIRNSPLSIINMFGLTNVI